MSYLTVIKENTAEYTEKRSRFIATLRHCETEEELAAFLEEMRSKYWDARHNCYACSLKEGALCRFSDDGEPHGTAGKPMLDIIAGSGITDIAVVVTRYFGGVLLGTGGLVRAYSAATRDVLQTAQVVEMVNCTLYKTVCEYSDHQKLEALIQNSGGKIENTDFADKVSIYYSLKNELADDFFLKLVEVFSARLTAEVVEKKITAFEI